jgi:hypothetical protein
MDGGAQFPGRVRFLVGQAFLPAIELVSGGHSCPPDPTRIRSAGRNARTRGFGQTRMSASPKRCFYRNLVLPGKLGTPRMWTDWTGNTWVLPHFDGIIMMI